MKPLEVEELSDVMWQAMCDHMRAEAAAIEKANAQLKQRR
jgi:hypothetical protein